MLRQLSRSCTKGNSVGCLVNPLARFAVGYRYPLERCQRAITTQSRKKQQPYKPSKHHGKTSREGTKDPTNDVVRTIPIRGNNLAKDCSLPTTLNPHPMTQRDNIERYQTTSNKSKVIYTIIEFRRTNAGYEKKVEHGGKKGYSSPAP